MRSFFSSCLLQAFNDRSTVAEANRPCASIPLSDSASAEIAGPPHAPPTLLPPKTSPPPTPVIPLPQSPVTSATRAITAGQAAGAKGARTRSPRGCLILQFERSAWVGTLTFAELALNHHSPGQRRPCAIALMLEPYFGHYEQD